MPPGAAEELASCTMPPPTGAARAGGTAGDVRRPTTASAEDRPPCRTLGAAFEKLNVIDEGTYGVVYRARNVKTGEVVALKRLKLEREREGFPQTSVRELSILLSMKHPNVIDVREVVTGDASRTDIYVVMEYMDHDLRALMDAMPHPFTTSEVKTLMKQLLSGLAYLHNHWVVHRDIKTSNVLMNNYGECKICDFGLARRYGSPLSPMTHMVVTLWYRAPELLLGGSMTPPGDELPPPRDDDDQRDSAEAGGDRESAQTSYYSTGVDLWSMGCVFAELLQKEALFPGKSELDMIQRIFALLGTPNRDAWPEYPHFAATRRFDFPNHARSRLAECFPPYNPASATYASDTPTLSASGLALLEGLLTYNPVGRISAAAAVDHPWFGEHPHPKDMALMPTYPSSNDGTGLTRAELSKKRKERN